MKDINVDARFVAPRVGGHLRLWAGMVLANRPWMLFPSFKGALAAALATGAYVLVIPTIWGLADLVGWERLLGLMVAAIVAMVVWVVVAHELWERPTSREARHWVALYNGVTVLTMSVAVLFSYAVLFALIFLAAWVFVPSTYFQSTLKHPVGLLDYAALAWMATSLATVAGALGAAPGHLQRDEVVRGDAQSVHRSGEAVERAPRRLGARPGRASGRICARPKEGSFPSYQTIANFVERR
jgi:hypothetical protein